MPGLVTVMFGATGTLFSIVSRIKNDGMVRRDAAQLTLANTLQR